MSAELPKLTDKLAGLRTGIGRAAVATLAATSFGTAAKADTLGYPHASMPCEHAPYNVEGYCANYDWGPLHTERYDDPSEYSSRGYTYRNCTDYVAWKLQSLNVPDANTRGLGNGGQWYDMAPAGARSSTPQAWDAAVVPGNPGHVAFVESVNDDGTITVSEYNHDGMGHGDIRTGTPAAMGFSEFVDFGVHPNGNAPTGPAAIPRMMVIDSAGNVYAKDGLADGWVLEYGEGNARSISVGATGRMMLIDKAGTAYQKDSLTAPWTKQADSASQVAVGSTGRMALIDGAGNAYAKDNPTDPWTLEYSGGGARDIAVGAIGRLMLVDGAGNSYEKETDLGGPWSFQSAKATRVAVGGVTGRLMVEDYTGNVYAKDNPGEPWVQQYGNNGARDIAAGGNGRMMVIDAAGRVYQKDGLNGPWSFQASTAKDVAVGTSGRMMLIDGAGNAYAKDNPGDVWTLEASGGGNRAVAVG